MISYLPNYMYYILRCIQKSDLYIFKLQF
ncbi:unnamed protein product, partial [Leptidea sinapis]